MKKVSLNKDIKKQAVRFWGGKHTMAPFIIEKIPPHRCYVENFCGSASVFFRKTPSRVEVLNDRNKALFMFFKTLRENGEEFKKQLNLVPYSENEFKHALQIYRHPEGFSPMKVALSFYIVANQCFSGNFSNWGKNNGSKRHQTKESFFARLGELDKVITRIKQASIYNEDALDMIDRFDDKETFFYIDPPYLEADATPYKGNYTEKDFKKLLDKLKSIKGKFLLSFYKTLNIDVPFPFYEYETYLRSKTRIGMCEKRTEILYHNL